MSFFMCFLENVLEHCVAAVYKTVINCLGMQTQMVVCRPWSELSKCLTSIGTNCQKIEPFRQQLGTVQTDTAQMVRQVCDLDARFDDAENHSLDHGINDTNSTESLAHSEELVIRHCADHPNFTLDAKEIKQVHRLGR